MPFNFTLFLAIFLFQSSVVNSTIHLSTFFRYFNHAQHCQKMQQQPGESKPCSTSETNLNNFELLSKSAKMQYTASISPPGRYLIIAWNGFKNSFGNCKEKCIKLGNNETQLFFTMNAFSDLNSLTECFLHFYLTNSDANGQFELKHNFLGENMGKICWPTFCDSSDDCMSKCWSGKKQQFKDPNRIIVHLQIIPLDEKLKPIPSLYNDNIAAQITKDYKVEELCNKKEDKQKIQQIFSLSLNPSRKKKEIIEYHDTNKCAIINSMLNNWTNSFDLLAHEDAYFLVAYLRALIYEVESWTEIGNTEIKIINNDFFSTKNEVTSLMSKYGDTLMTAFLNMKILAISDSNLIAEILAMTNQMCSLMPKVPQFVNVFKNWQLFCHEFDLAYKRFAKKRNKFVFSLLDRCLFDEKLCLVDQQTIYYVEHLVFQSERIISNKKLKISQMNEHDQNFLAQIGQLLSVASANKIDEHFSYLEEKVMTLGKLKELFESLCKNWQEFVEKIENKAKFKAWTKLCKSNIFILDVNNAISAVLEI